MSLRRGCPSGIAVVLCCVSGSAAAQIGAAGHDYFDDYRACSRLSAPMERLTCFETVFRRHERDAGSIEGSPAAALDPEMPGQTEVSAAATTAQHLHEEIESLKAENSALLEERARFAVRDDSTAVAESGTADNDRFGLSETRGPKSPAETRREMELVSARRVAGGSGVYFMDNGQVWTLVTGSYRPVKAGVKVVIEEALFGSYRMIIEGRGYRVRRVR